MGWTFTHREPGISHLDWFRREWPNTGARIEELTSVGTTLYGTYRTDDDRVIALVILTRRAPRDYFNFGYKEMEESMGPCEVDMPERLFAKLTPLPDPQPDGTDPHRYARDWRAAVAARIERKRNRPKLTKGVRVRFAKPLTFSNGDERDTFVFAGRNSFHPVYDGEYTGSSRYSIPNWADREYAIL